MDAYIAGRATMITDGLTTIRSAHGPEVTMNRFEAEARARGMTVYCSVDHAAAAARIGLSLRPTDLLIFGHAGTSTPLIEKAQTLGIDLPHRVLVWLDASGVTWLSYSDATWLAKHHGLDPANVASLRAMTAALHEMAQTATAP